MGIASSSVPPPSLIDSSSSLFLFPSFAPFSPPSLLQLDFESCIQYLFMNDFKPGCLFAVVVI